MVGSMSVGSAKKKTSSSCPFGEGFYSKITKLLLSKEPTAVKELRECVKMVSAAKLTPTDEFWDSGDEIAPVDTPSSSSGGNSTTDGRPTATKKAGTDRPRIIHLDMVPNAEKRVAAKAKVDPPPVPEKKRKGPVVLPGARRSDDSDSDDAKTNEKPCKKCGEKSTTNVNPMFICEGCRASYHQKCHKPEVTTQQSADPRFIFLCTDCTGKGVGSTPAPRSGSDISATFEAYKKKKERQVMKAKAALSK
ncbi:PHD-finger [Necator americanus]|uniref:PHD-finger n=1 Tax=Necator americanus TaxID=51031 RepID=W2TCS9_NECAM|nr:PHD-finger [Necator americanus]ETN78797.1 PHD-finger [Necator americanus]